MPRLSTFRDGVLGWLAQVEPAKREIFLASLVLLAILFVGTFGYYVIEGWPFLDGLYMTFITLTTIGFTEVHTLTNTGRFFTILIALMGIGVVAFIATRSAQILIAGERIRERHLMRKINQMQNHYILCGYGRIGRRVAEDLQRGDCDFVVVDADDQALDPLGELGIPWVHGDAEDDETLERAGIHRARGLILTLPDDSDNVFVTLIARELNPDLYILSRISESKNERRLIHAGADKVIAPNDVGADRMAQVILRPHVDRFMENILRTGMLGMNMEEVTVQPGAPLAGKTLAESNFRQQFDAIVIAIIEAEAEETRFNPSPHYRIEPDDILIVLGNQDMIRRLRKEGCEV